jgi:hypothetical protein
MKLTGDDELDFIREAGSEVLNMQAKAYYKYALPGQSIGVVVLSGLIWLLSGTVALWVVTILGGLLSLQALAVTAMQLKARHVLKKHTKNQTALNKITDDFFGM